MKSPGLTSIERLLADIGWFAPHMAAIAEIYALMDADYEQMARNYGFRCIGCEDNCCQTRFHHHTLIELCFLYDGFAALSSEVAQDMGQRAWVFSRSGASSSEAALVASRMCPVNAGGLCLLYAHRPMICRLHGLPNIMTLPDGQSRRGSGCAVFHKYQGSGEGFGLDRTPHYTRMAALEQQLRRIAGWQGRVHLTVADMICAFTNVNVKQGRRLER